MIYLHGIVRGAVTSVFGDEAISLVQSAGQANVNGRIIPTYSEPVAMRAQIQSMGSDELAHYEKTDSTKVYRKAWLNESAAYPVAGIVRRHARNGDFIRRADGSWWLVTAVIDDFSRAGWVSVAITLQTAGPVVPKNPQLAGGVNATS